MNVIRTPHHHESEFDRVMGRRQIAVPVWLYAILQVTRKVFVPFIVIAAVAAMAWFSYKEFTAPAAWYRYVGGPDGRGEIVWVEIGGEEILFSDLTVKQKKEAQSFEFGGYAGPNAEQELRDRAKRKP